jgi:hypothetical protein
MRLQHRFKRLACELHGGIIQGSLRKRGRKAAGDQHDVALAQRNLEPFGEPHQHLARGRGAPRFHEAQVPRGDFRIEREIELAQVPALPPLPQVFADVSGMNVHHGAETTMRVSQLPLPAR